VNTDPADTVALLDELESLGFDNGAFSVVHHFEPAPSIARHRHYCSTRVERFEPGGTNARVQQRLRAILGAYRGGGFQRRSADLFEFLARAAVVEFPFTGPESKQ
jgi:hypothetical protein